MFDFNRRTNGLNCMGGCSAVSYETCIFNYLIPMGDLSKSHRRGHDLSCGYVP